VRGGGGGGKRGGGVVVVGLRIWDRREKSWRRRGGGVEDLGSEERGRGQVSVRLAEAGLYGMLPALYSLG